MFKLVAIEYMPKTFTTSKGQSLEDMKQEITKLKKELRGMSSILISIWFIRGFERSLISL